jgi:serine/threonine protein phosphatase 1
LNYFVIGDVHGCYHTFKNMINKYWNKENEMLIQLGDLIDRGRNSPQMVQLAIQLSADFPDQVTFLKGNHEFEIIDHFTNQPNTNWLRQCGNDTLKQYKKINRDCKSDVSWLSELPLNWENKHIFISHAGISELTENPFDENDEFGVLWNRSPLKNIGKLQIIGHTPTDRPKYDVTSNAWNIDTGAAYLGYLTGVKIKANGQIIEFIREDTDPRDK